MHMSCCLPVETVMVMKLFCIDPFAVVLMPSSVALQQMIL